MVSTKKLSLGSRCVKYLMFIFNLLFVITGIILLSIGVAIHGIYYNYQHFLDNKFLSVPSLLIAIGTIIFFIAFFGCCGAVRENYCMIVTFHCCGTTNATDWITIGHMSKTNIPASCCVEVGITPPPKNCTITPSGCYDIFVSFIKSHAVQLGGVGLGIAFVQAMGIWFSVFLARSIRNTYETVMRL